MKKTLLTVICGLVTLLPLAAQTPFVNLTPKAKLMTTTAGELPLPEGFVVNTANLADSLAAEATKFVEAINAATPLNATTASNDATALIQMALPTTALDAEGYKLFVKEDGVKIEAATSAGFYYAFQTLKKILPANVMAGVKDETVTTYALPLVNINDAPRFGYRGFMLDVARTWVTTADVKRYIDWLAYHKINRLHWHLSDDQGWRVEIKSHPELTEQGGYRGGYNNADNGNGERQFAKEYQSGQRSQYGNKCNRKGAYDPSAKYSAKSIFFESGYFSGCRKLCGRSVFTNTGTM